MRTILFMIFALCFSCSTKPTDQIKDNYIIMNDLWQRKASAEEVKKTFGDNFKEVNSGIVYTFPNSKFPEFGFFFDSSNKLRSQFAFMDEASLARFKKALKCNWQETEEKKTVAHYIRTIKKGLCPSLSISYETNLGLNAYEVRWK